MRSTSDDIHKRKPLSDGRAPRALCGRYGPVTALWRKVTCSVCKKRRPKVKR